MASAESLSVRVLVRFRPINDRERAEQQSTNPAHFSYQVQGETGVALAGTRFARTSTSNFHASPTCASCDI